MDFLLAKIKGKDDTLYYKVLSNQAVFTFDIDSYSDFVEYHPDHNLDRGTLFKILKFSSQPFCLKLLKKNIRSPDFNQLPQQLFKNIDFLCSVQNGVVCFQRVTPATYLKSSRAILSISKSISKESKVESSENKLFLNLIPDAVYIPKQDILVFRDLERISPIFVGIDVLFKEATDEQVGEFLSYTFIRLSGGYDVPKVGKHNRMLISLHMEKLQQLNDNERNEMLDYIHDYCKDLPYNADEYQFTISNNEQLKYILYGIDERYHTTKRGQQKRMANSVRVMK